MKFFVTGVGGQLGHDVMNELLKRGYEGVGSDMQEACDMAAPYMSLDITNRNAVEKAITDVNPDAVIHSQRGRPWTWRRMMKTWRKYVLSTLAARRTLRMSARS